MRRGGGAQGERLRDEALEARLRRLDAALLLPVSFAGLILVGTALLSLPIAAADGRPVGILDALFTATSAACVTGLITLDTATAWSPVGQGIILALIQLGGLGILTFSTFFAILLGRRLTLGQRDIAARSHGMAAKIDVRGLVMRVVTYALALELVGAVVLSAFFAREAGLGSGIWRGVFHAISAFCNAGFSLFSDSLEGYAGSWTVNLVVMALIFLGGIGFIVMTDLEKWLRQGKRPTLHTRVALATSGILLAGTALAFWGFEAGNILRGRAWDEQALVILFQSVTPRTAGFNTVPYAELTNSTLMLTMLLMFIGGSPGSTAGGVKTTTAAILYGLLASKARRFRNATLFRRTVPERLVGEATAMVLLSILIVMAGTFLLQWTELFNLPHPEIRGDFLELNFEAVSAFGTVGLSMGETEGLRNSGKLVVIALMFIGRLGPLTFAVAIGGRRRRRWEYAEEAVLVG